MGKPASLSACTIYVWVVWSSLHSSPLGYGGRIMGICLTPTSQGHWVTIVLSDQRRTPKVIFNKNTPTPGGGHWPDLVPIPLSPSRMARVGEALRVCAGPSFLRGRGM